MKRKYFPMVTIIGQKGVGKTTLFHQVTKKYSTRTKQKASPLVNYVEELISIKNNTYKLVDTPSFILSPKTEIEKEIRKQTEELLKKSDLIFWVVGQVEEKTLLLSKYLKKSEVPQILLFNDKSSETKEDTLSRQILKLNRFLFVGVLREINFEELMEMVINFIPSPESEKVIKDKNLSLTIFGPPNSGKSTLMNYLLKENRSLTTPIAGTTQEPVVSQWNWKKIEFELVDTAGVTKEQKLKEGIWRNCDLAWAVVDATLPLTKQILQIINLGEKHNKPLIIIINKCDLVADQKSLMEELRSRLKSLKYVPIIYSSALKGIGMKSLLKVLEKMLEQAQKKLSKRELAEVVEKMLASNPPKYFKGNKLKIYFAKQEPGLIQYFIFFVNSPQWAHFSYQRYITNSLRKKFDLEYLPIKVIFKKSS